MGDHPSTKRSLAGLLARLYDQLPEDERSLPRDIEAAVRNSVAGLERDLRRLRVAAIEYRSERDILRLVARAPADGVIGSREPQGFVAAAARAIEKMPRVERGCVALFDTRHKQPLILETIRVPEDERPHLDEQISTGIIARVRETGQEIYCEEANEDTLYRELASVQALQMKTVLCCPIRGEGDRSARGAIYVENRSQAAAFPEAWREAVQLLAGQMALHLSLMESDGITGFDPTQPFRRGDRYREIVGCSQVTARMLRFMDRVGEQADTPTLLITGETGVGKDLVAHCLHRYGRRRDGPFVAVNAANLQPTVVESELFGTVKGAFTGAIDRPGLFHKASGGILFLDEIGEIPLEVQVKLLRVLDDHRVRRVGSRAEEIIDVWVIAATNADLRQAVDEGHFRKDLFYRLSTTLLAIPPLRERPDDIEALADFFAEQVAARSTAPTPYLSPDLMVALRAQRWEGNVRELHSMMELLLDQVHSTVITAADMRRAAEGFISLDDEREPLSWEQAGERFRESYLRWAMERWGPSPAIVAVQLGIHRTYLYRLCQKYQIPIG